MVEVIEGDPKVVLMEAANRYKAQMFIVGSHGYGAIKWSF
jgi:nucleotide-binding universal stress UspA family protein